MKIKKIFSLILLFVCASSLFAKTKSVAEKKLGSALEKNKDASMVFVSEIDLRQMEVTENGTVILPLLKNKKIKVVSGMNMTGINTRIAEANKKKFETTFEVKDLATKTYAITKIDGIENAPSSSSLAQTATSITKKFNVNSFWKDYGGGLKNGDNLAGVGVGFAGYLPIIASYERMVHINNTIPLSFGATASVNLLSSLSFNAFGTAKWHFNFGIDKLDVFLGAMLGAWIIPSSSSPVWLSGGGTIGASWFFTDKFAVTLESGYPYYGTLKATMKF